MSGERTEATKREGRDGRKDHQRRTGNPRSGPIRWKVLPFKVKR